LSRLGEYRMHPLTGEMIGEPRIDLTPRDTLSAISGVSPRSRRINASFDAARDIPDHQNYWANADALDADTSHSKAVRAKIVKRSRYEIGNNGYTDGMVQTYATYTVGSGPVLRMKSASDGFNRAVESLWDQWQKAVKFRRKLWCMSHAKMSDGEGFGVVRTNYKVRSAIKLDVVLFETEQCQSYDVGYAERGRIDGIRFDEFGNPEFYEILPQHPGGNFSYANTQPEQVPARFVLHWFAMRRPGQHRGIPELKSTLNLGASARRWREATLAAAETAADFAVMLKTNFQPEEIDRVAPMSTLEIQKRMMTALPEGWAPEQMEAKHPNATFDSYNDSLISEQGRPKSIPKNIAKCDSSQYNYASGRLDHQTFYASIDAVDRPDCEDSVLEPLFDLWFQEAAIVYGWNVDPLAPPPHEWGWPKHPVADIVSEAQASDIKLKNGTITLGKEYSNNSQDFTDEIEMMAKEYGLTVDEMRRVLRTAIFNNSNQLAGMATAENQAKNG
jgi:capsid protein